MVRYNGDWQPGYDEMPQDVSADYQFRPGPEYQQGYSHGYNQGYNHGYQHGYDHGHQHGHEYGHEHDHNYDHGYGPGFHWCYWDHQWHPCWR